jgi:hypothetical protein
MAIGMVARMAMRSNASCDKLRTERAGRFLEKPASDERFMD